MNLNVSYTHSYSDPATVPFPFTTEYLEQSVQSFWHSFNVQKVGETSSSEDFTCQIKREKYLYVKIVALLYPPYPQRTWSFNFTTTPAYPGINYWCNTEYNDFSSGDRKQWSFKVPPQNFPILEARFASAGFFLPPDPDVLDWKVPYSEPIVVGLPEGTAEYTVLYRFKIPEIGGLLLPACLFLMGQGVGIPPGRILFG